MNELLKTRSFKHKEIYHGTQFNLFLGNQYRLIVDEQEYFISLLFSIVYKRSLYIELKTRRIKPNMKSILSSALDEYASFENPSIGIISANHNVRKPLNSPLATLQNRWVLLHKYKLLAIT